MEDSAAWKDLPVLADPVAKGKRRWNVEVKPDVFHDVKAEDVSVASGGVLTFYDDGRLTLAYAPGTWLTLSEAE